MPLDPQIEPLVAANRAAAAELPPVWSQTVEQRREMYLALADLAGPGPELPRVVDVEIAGVPCRLYEPDDAEGTILYFHGGGFAIGDLETHDEPCRQVAHDARATLIAVDYRRAPEHTFPAPIDDGWAVLRAIAAGPEAWGLDGRIVLVGDSAGGTIAAVLALMSRDAGIDVAAQILIYPTTHVADTSPSMVDNADGPVLTREIYDWYLHLYQPDPDDWRASPLLAPSHDGLPRTLVITSQYDMLRDQGVAYATALREAGVEVVHTDYEGMVHAFFQLGPLVDAARAAVTQVADEARAVLRG